MTTSSEPIKSGIPTTGRKQLPEKNQPEDGDSRLITLTEAAFRLGRVHRTTIMRWVREGKLKCVRLSRKAILFEQVELDRFIREHRYSG
jgi:excisionase family DNA binding protein